MFVRVCVANVVAMWEAIIISGSCSPFWNPGRQQNFFNFFLKQLNVKAGDYPASHSWQTVEARASLESRANERSGDLVSFNEGRAIDYPPN